MDWRRDDDPDGTPRSPVVQRGAGMLLAWAVDSGVAVTLFVLAVTTPLGSLLGFAVVAFPLLQFVVLLPLATALDRVVPEMARGVLMGGLAVFGLWMVAPMMAIALVFVFA